VDIIKVQTDNQRILTWKRSNQVNESLKEVKVILLLVLKRQNESCMEGHMIRAVPLEAANILGRQLVRKEQWCLKTTGN
jgi:hypothetical protein